MREQSATKANVDQRIRTKEKRDLKEKNRFKKDKADLKRMHEAFVEKIRRG